MRLVCCSLSLEHSKYSKNIRYYYYVVVIIIFYDEARESNFGLTVLS